MMLAGVLGDLVSLVDCVLADFGQTTEWMGQISVDFQLSQALGPCRSLVWGLGQGPGVGHYLHLDNITGVPWARQEVGQAKPEHAAPKLTLRCNI